MSIRAHYRALCLSAVLVPACGISAAHAAPNACALVTVAEMAQAIGRPVTGGTLSVVDNPDSPSSSCPYAAGPLTIMVMASQFQSAAQARAEFDDELGNTRDHDGDTQKTSPESEPGDAAFLMTMGSGASEVVSYTCLRATRIVTVSLVGQGAKAVPVERLRGVLETSLTR